MNVSTSGVKGYEYQYKATVLIALSYKLENIKLFVESLDSEDAKLELETSEGNVIVEIQIKSEKGNISLKKISEWLTHFTNRKDNNNLLYRVQTQSHICLFITQARCSDETVFLKRDFLIEPIIQNISNAKKKDFCYHLKSNYSKRATTLEKGRNDFCKAQASGITNTTILQDIFSRIHIWEEIYEKIIDDKIMNILNKSFSIPQSQTEEVYLALLQEIQRGRDKSNDVVPELYKVIRDKRIGRPLLSKLYKPRNEESSLMDKIYSESVIPLTGNTYCGKSELAKRIALNLVEKGFAYRITNDVTDVINFFTQNPTEDKVVVLEDPWGHLEKKPDSNDIWSKLEHLISNKLSNHKLIITTRIEILRDIKSLTKSPHFRIDKYSWIDLTIRDNKTILEFWDYFISGLNIPVEILNKFQSSLMNSSPDHLLQIGQLARLTKLENYRWNEIKVEELEEIARYNSKDIAENVLNKNKECAELLSVIAICASSISPVSMEDLSYILDTDEEYYSINEDEAISFMSLTEAKKKSFNYSKKYQLSEKQSNELEYLENGGFIRVDGELIFFVHPNYYEAGKLLLVSRSFLQQKRVLNYFKRALSCLSTDAAYSTACLLKYLYENIKDDFQNDVLQLVFYGLRSIFPSVEDTCLIFLADKIEFINNEYFENAIRAIERGDTNISQIFWENEMPYILNDTAAGGFFHNRGIKLQEDELNEINKKLSGEVAVYPKQAVSYLDNIGQLTELNPLAVKTLLSYKEVFIRKTIAKDIFLHKLNFNDVQIIRQVFSDSHPSVVFNAIRGCFSNWNKLKTEVKEVVLPLINDKIQNSAIAIRASTLIQNFAIDYAGESINWYNFQESEKVELWNIWGDLYPLFITNLPPNVFINAPRFSVTINEALKHLTIQRGMNVFDAWYKRIDIKIKAGYELDDYELSIADELITFTKEEPTQRIELFRLLVSHTDTGFIVSSLKWIVAHWDILLDEEKNLIYALIKSNREDKRWISAVILNTYSSPPNEIQDLVLKNPVAFDLPEDDFIKLFSEELLLDCLRVFRGSPQPLWWYAVHHYNRECWLKIMKHIIRNELYPYFPLCLNEMLSDGVNGYSNFWSNGLELWREIVNKSSKKEYLATSLFYWVSRCSCNLVTTKKLFDILIASYSDINEIGKLIANNIELLQHANSKHDLFKFFDADFFEKVLFPLLSPDYELYTYLTILQSIKPADESSIEILNLLIDNAINKGYKLFATSEVLQKLVIEAELKPDILERIKEIPNNIKEIGKAKKMEFDALEFYTLDNWNGKH